MKRRNAGDKHRTVTEPQTVDQQGGSCWRMHACERFWLFACVCIFCAHACVHENVCHSCNGRNRWAGDVDSCAWGILWRWGSECRLRSTLGPSYPLQHVEPFQHQPIMDQPPTPSVSQDRQPSLLPPPSQSCVLASPALLPHHHPHEMRWKSNNNNF